MIDNTAECKKILAIFQARCPLASAFTRIGLLSSPTQKGLQSIILDMHLQMTRQSAGDNASIIQHAQNAGNAVINLERLGCKKWRAY